MGTFLKTVITVLFSVSTLFAAGTPPVADMAALVNGAAITTADFRGELARILRIRKKTEQEVDPTKLALTKKEALETLIGRELLFQESQREGIRVQDSDVYAEIAKLRRQFPREEDFNASLGKLDLSREAVQSQIKREMAIQALIDSRFSANTFVKESEALDYYINHQDAYIQPVQVRLSHILIKVGTLVNSSGKTSARTKVEDIYRRVSQGEDFALLARESDDSKSSLIGGDLGYFTPGQLGKPVEAAAFSLAVGKVSTIIEDRFGYHILKVTERRPESVLPFEDVKERISTQLRRERTLGEVTPYLKRLRKAATVKIYLTGEN
jgi:peptidyl-prolyl cis-trans isomerase C